MQFGDQLHCHMFLVTALPRLLLGWDFLKTHHASLKAAPETVHFRCGCPPPVQNAGPIRTLPRWPHARRPMRPIQRERCSAGYVRFNQNKTSRTGLTNSDFPALPLQRDQYQKSNRNKSSDHLLLLSRNLSEQGLMQQTYCRVHLQQMYTSPEF